MDSVCLLLIEDYVYTTSSILMLKGVWVATDLTTRLYMYFGRHYASATVEDEWVTCHYAYRVETSLDWKAETDIVGNDLNTPLRGIAEPMISRSKSSCRIS